MLRTRPEHFICEENVMLAVIFEKKFYSDLPPLSRNCGIHGYCWRAATSILVPVFWGLNLTSHKAVLMSGSVFSNNDAATLVPQMDRLCWIKTRYVNGRKTDFVLFVCFISFVFITDTASSISTPWKSDRLLTLPSHWRTPQMLGSRGWWPPEHLHQRWTPHRTEPLVYHLPPLVCQSHLCTYSQEVRG